MSKNTNKLQLKCFVSIMENHYDIACGFHKRPKEEVAEFWKMVERELNSLGPPRKQIIEWKKVWSDQKKYVRKKATQNPFKKYRFSEVEEAIHNMIGMQNPMEFVDSMTFELGPSTSKVNLAADEMQPPVSICKTSIAESETSERCVDSEHSVQLDDSETEPYELLTKEPYELLTASIKHTPNQTQLPPPKANSAKEFEEKVEIPKQLCDQVEMAVENLREQHNSTKQIYRSLDRLYEMQKTHFNQMRELKKIELEENKRHHLEMEHFRKCEIEAKMEMNNRLLEIEELKLNVSKKDT